MSRPDIGKRNQPALLSVHYCTTLHWWIPRPTVVCLSCMTIQKQWSSRAEVLLLYDFRGSTNGTNSSHSGLKRGHMRMIRTNSGKAPITNGNASLLALRTHATLLYYLYYFKRCPRTLHITRLAGYRKHLAHGMAWHVRSPILLPVYWITSVPGGSVCGQTVFISVIRATSICDTYTRICVLCTYHTYL